MQKIVIVTLIVIGGILGGIKAWNRIPCANPGSCSELPKLAIDNKAFGTYEGQSIVAPTIDPTEVDKPVLGEQTTTLPKHIYVDLSTQTLSAYEGDNLVMRTFVSTGKWGRTPVGEYKIWSRFRAVRMTGGSGADYYDLPNVPYVMFFYNSHVPQISGYSFHGAYWHDNFGHVMSHGCVNMREIDAKQLYEWVGPNMDAEVTIY